MACLTLVAPSGMTQDERREWVRVARQTLSGMPADLLAEGCLAARKTCRFPSEIVPAILAEAGERWERRKKNVAVAAAQEANKHLPRLERHEPSYIDPAEAAAILAEFGLKRVWQ